MNPLDQKKRMKAFAEKMNKCLPPTDEEYAYLSCVFSRLANGEEPAVVLGLAYQPGHSEEDAKTRQLLQFIIHWIESAIRPMDADPPGLGYTVTKACHEASAIMRHMTGNTETEMYDAEYVRQCFYKKEYAHMRKTAVGIYDPDSPYGR